MRRTNIINHHARGTTRVSRRLRVDPETREAEEEYTLTIWGRGVSCALAHAGRSVHWQGDEAAEIVDRVEERGPSVLPSIWADYEHIAEEDD